MKTLISVTVGIGSTAKENIPNETLELYKWISQTVLQEECRISDKSSELFLPISNWEMQHEPNKIYKQITDFFAQDINLSDIFLFDMSGPYAGIFRGQLLNHLASAIIWLTNKQDSFFTILLIDHIPPEGDVFLRTVQTLTDKGRLLLIDASGKHYPPSRKLPVNFQFDFLSKLNEVRTKPIDLLKFKLVPRLGHFKWYVDGKHVSCHRYFYDGTKCKSEIVTLLKNKISSIKSLGQTNIDAIVYHAPFSPWLEEPLFTINEDLNIPIYQFNDFIKRKQIGNKLSSVIIVAALVNTSKTIAEVHSGVVKKAPTAQVSVLSVLTTAIDDNDNFTRSVGEGNHRFTVECIHKVELNSVEPDICPMCLLDIPASNMEVEDYDMFTTYDMWTMNDAAGFIEEQDIPPSRKELDFVPDYASMIATNGAWIAYKLQKVLESNGLSSLDLVVISPAQRVPKVFSSFLWHLLNVRTFIQIPSDFLKELLKNNQLNKDVVREAIRNSQEDWVKSLRTVTNENVVILDEFQASGRTFDVIQSILNDFKKKVKCYLPLIDFNPKKSAQSLTPTFSLYQIQRNWTKA